MFFISSGQSRSQVFGGDAIRDVIDGLWPDANWTDLGDSPRPYRLAWSISRDGKVIEGLVADDDTTIAFDADVTEAAELALALRRELDAELVFFDEQNTAIVELKPEVSLADIAGPFMT